MPKFLMNFIGIFKNHPFTFENFKQKIKIIEEEAEKMIYPRLIMKKISEINPNLKYSYQPLSLTDLFKKYFEKKIFYERNYHLMDKNEKEKLFLNINIAKENCIYQTCDFLTEITKSQIFKIEYTIKEKKFILNIEFNTNDNEMSVKFNYIENIYYRECFDGFLNEKKFTNCDIDEISFCINNMLLNAEKIIISDNPLMFKG